MDEFKNVLQKKLKNKKEGLVVESSPNNFLQKLSVEMEEEIEQNPFLKFKKSISNTIKEEKENRQETVFKLFDLIQPAKEETSDLKEEVFFEEVQKPQENIPKNLITIASEAITKEQSKIVNEYTDLFNQPNVTKPDPNIKTLQNKVKFLEEWATKISTAGPGSGEVNFRWLDDVDRSTIGNTDQILRFNPNENKFFFGQLSGDQGPIRSLEFDNSGAGVENPNPGTLEWNSAKDCLNIYQNDNTVLQVGLENYIRVHNITGNTLNNGTLVQFSGVNGDHETPTCAPFIANGDSNPIYVIGILTEDIPHDGYGRATTFGEVRDLNTTGSDVSEVWNNGDLLWASDTNPGKLTKVRPTAPSVVISIAAVLKANSESGLLLVRPTIYPRMYYGSFYDTTTQTANTINTPYSIRYSNTQISTGFSIANNSQIVANNAGLYNYQFSIQVTSGSSDVKNLWIWYRKNGQDVPHSATKISIASNKEVRVPAWNFIESMEIGEYFELMWAAGSTDVQIAAIAEEAFCPAIPSVILTVTQVTL